MQDLMKMGLTREFITRWPRGKDVEMWNEEDVKGIFWDLNNVFDWSPKAIREWEEEEEARKAKEEYERVLGVPYPSMPSTSTADETFADLTSLELSGIDLLTEKKLEKQFHDKMFSLYRLRQQVGGRTRGVSMPRYDVKNFWQDPQILDCYIKIERFKLQQKAGQKHTPKKTWHPFRRA